MSAFAPPTEASSVLVDPVRVALREARDLAQAVLSYSPYLIVSACIINFNKYLLDSTRFPYAVTLTWVHAGVTSATMMSLYFGLDEPRRARWFPKMQTLLDRGRGDVKPLAKGLGAAAVAFVFAVVLQNEAFRYCSVPFLQSSKLLNGCIVYALALLVGQEVFDPHVALTLLLICGGVYGTVTGEFAFSHTGFLYQLGGQTADCCKVLVQSWLLTSAGVGLDPLTTLLLMCPICFLLLAPVVPFLELGDPAFLPRLWEHRHMLALNCANAVLLNVCIVTTVQKAGGVTFVLLGIVKFLVIVGLAQVLTGVQVSARQVIGYSIATVGLFLHSQAKKQRALKAEKASTQYGSLETKAVRQVV